MQITKQQKWWKRSLNTFLATALVASSVSFAGTPQKVKAAPTAGPGGVSDGLISWVDVERSAVIKEGTNQITQLTDLAGVGYWSPNGGVTAANDSVPNALNFNGGIQIASNKGFYTRPDSQFNTNDVSREVFSVQASDNHSGFPWEFGGENTGTKDRADFLYPYF